MPGWTVQSRSLGIDLEHLVHAAHIDADAAMRRVDMALERGAGAEGDQRHAMLAGDRNDRLDLGRTLRKDDAVGQLRRNIGGRVGMLRADGLAGLETIAEPLAHQPHGGSYAGFVADARPDRLQRHLSPPNHRCASRKFLDFNALLCKSESLCPEPHLEHDGFSKELRQSETVRSQGRNSLIADPGRLRGSVSYSAASASCSASACSISRCSRGSSSACGLAKRAMTR